MNKNDLTDKQKQSLIDYMVKYCGYTPHNARRRFEKWESERMERLRSQKHKKDLIEGKKMTEEQIKTMVLYLHRRGYINSWIAESMGIPETKVSSIIIKHKRSI